MTAIDPKPAFAGLLLALTVATSLPVSAAAGWLTYSNDRYGTTIDYPDFFKTERPPDADDGRKFTSADGAEFTVSASYGGVDSNLAEYREFILKNIDPGSTVTYRAEGRNWFVISGSTGNKIFYERHMLSHGGEMTEDFVMSYPAALKTTYDPIVARMAKSFRSGKGFQSP